MSGPPCNPPTSHRWQRIGVTDELQCVRCGNRKYDGLAARAARAAAPPVEPLGKCETCGTELPTRDDCWRHKCPDPVAGLREHRPDILVDYDGVVVVCSQQDCPARGFNWWEVHVALAEPVPLDVERLLADALPHALALASEQDETYGYSDEPGSPFVKFLAAALAARLTAPKGATDGE